MKQHRYHFKIGNIRFLISSVFPIPVFHAENWGLFLIEEKDVDVRINYYLEEATSLSRAIFNKNEVDFLEKCSCYKIPINKHKLLRSQKITNILRCAIKKNENIFIDFDKSAISILNYSSKQTDFFMTPSQKRSLADFSLGPSLIAPYLTSFSSLLIHASCALRADKAFLFLAPDEGGKTTAILLSEKNKIISDDHVLLKQIGRDFVAFPTPWAKHRSDGLRAKIKTVFLLEKAAKFSISPLKKSYLIKFIWDEHFSFHTYLPKELKKMKFKLISDLVEGTETFLLRFPKNHIDWTMIDQLVNDNAKNS